MSATGFIETQYNNPGTLQIEGVGAALQGSPPSGNQLDYQMDFWVQADWDGVTPINGSSANFFFDSGDSPYILVDLGYVGAAGFTPPGYGIAVFNGASTTPVQAQIKGTNAGGQTCTWGDWNRITIGLHYGDASHGYLDVFLNGEYLTSVLTDLTASTWSNKQFSLTFPQWAGVKWRVCSAQAWNGTDLAVQPMWILDAKATSKCLRVYQPIGFKPQSGNTQGACFQSGGTGAVALDAEYVGSSSPNCYLLSFTGNGNSPWVETFDELGTPTYNAQGWAHYVWEDTSVATGTSWTAEIYQAGGTTDLFKITATAATADIRFSYLGEASLIVCPYSLATRYIVQLSLNKGWPRQVNDRRYHDDDQRRHGQIDLFGTAPELDAAAARAYAVYRLPDSNGRAVRRFQRPYDSLLHNRRFPASRVLRVEHGPRG